MAWLLHGQAGIAARASAILALVLASALHPADAQENPTLAQARTAAPYLRHVTPALAKPRTVAQTPADRLAVSAHWRDGDRAEVDADGYLRLRLADGTVVWVMATSDTALKQQREADRARGARVSQPIHERPQPFAEDAADSAAPRIFETPAPGVVASVRG